MNRIAPAGSSGSVITDSVNPLTACFAPRYADCNGIDRNAIADPTLTMT
jgi:hypothetical protein